MVARGKVQNGVVVLENGLRLPEGQKVTVEVVEPIPLGERKYHVSPERREAILSLIGMLKTDQPAPTDEEVDQIIYDELMRKHG
jgi:hypothetical protein